jgi:hypothetical protein
MSVVVRRADHSRGEAWLYLGHTRVLDRWLQRQRITRDCGYVQVAYGPLVTRHGLPMRRTVGFQAGARIA